MTTLERLGEGSFRFLPGGLAYSQGVVVEPGFAIEHVRFLSPVPVGPGFSRIADHLAARGRPKAALCAVELRSPAPLSIDGFREFNRMYAGVLQTWGLVSGDVNAVARSNVAPVVDPPAEASFYGFSFTIPSRTPRTSFVVSGSSEWPEGGRFPEEVVRYGETSADALDEKAAFVLAAMERRMRSLGAGWSDATLTQSYSAFDVHRFLTEVVAPRGGARFGIVCHYCRPPVQGWEYEMDVRGVFETHVLE